MRGFAVDRASLSAIGRDLQRPECILAERNGTLWAADARGGVTRIDADGRQQFIGQQPATRPPAATCSTGWPEAT